MPICIECCYPVSQLYHVLHGRNHKATAASVSNPTHPKSTTNITSPQKPAPRVPKVGDTKAKSTTSVGGGGDVRLTQCPRCKRFADKYVEHDFVVLFIDLVLVKAQVSWVRLKAEASVHTPPGLLTLRRHLSRQSLRLTLYQVYRHLLFNRLSRQDEQLDVHFSPDTSQRKY